MIGVVAIILMLAYGSLSNIFGMHKVIDQTKFGVLQSIFTVFISLPFKAFKYYLLAEYIVEHLI